MANLQIIKELARERSFPLEQLAKELEITPQALSKIMRENSTKVATLERIAQILKVSVMVFFPEEKMSAPSDHSVVVSGNDDNVESTHQTTYGNNSPAVKGDNNHFGGCASVDAAISEIAEHRKLVERSLALLEKRDAQIDRLISILERSIPTMQ